MAPRELVVDAPLLDSSLGMDVDPRLLRPLAMLAEEQHFGRAAKRLGVTQPALTQQIARLEHQLGVRLFERTSRSVAPTEDGQRLAVQAKDVLDRIDAMVGATRTRSRARPVRVGLTQTVPLALVAALREGTRQLRRPGLVVSSRWSSELVPDVQAGRLDLGVGRVLPRARTLRYTTLADEEQHALVVPSHPLATRPGAVPLELFAESTLVVWPRTVSPGLHDHARAACRAAGFEPALRTVAFAAAPDLTDVAAELGPDGFGLAPRSLPVPSGTTAVALTDPPALPLVLVTPDRPSAAAREVGTLLTQAAAALRR